MKPAARTDDHLVAYAVGFAHFEHFPGADEAEILQRLGVEPAAWQAVETYGQAVLVHAAKVKDGATLAIYGRAFEHTKQALASRKATLGDVLKMTFPESCPPAAPPLLAELMAAKPRAARLVAGPPPAAGAPGVAVGELLPAPTPTPFPLPAPAADAPPRLTMEQYASLRAETMASTPETVATLRARYGLDEASEQREAALWSRRFASDAALFENYKAEFQRCRKLYVQASG